MATRTSPLSEAVIFNLKEGVVWAHLPGKTLPIALGDLDTVSYMMRDFLAQCELGND